MSEDKGGRPSIFSMELGATICARLAEGESLRTICSSEGMPSKSTVMRWLFEKDKQEFQDHYARAREIQAEAMAEDILDIADDSVGDLVVDAHGNERTNHEVVARSRLRVDARKWVASKLLPKKYGDKVQTELTGANGGPVEIKEILIRAVDPRKDGD